MQISKSQRDAAIQYNQQLSPSDLNIPLYDDPHHIQILDQYAKALDLNPDHLATTVLKTQFKPENIEPADTIYLKAWMLGRNPQMSAEQLNNQVLSITNPKLVELQGHYRDPKDHLHQEIDQNLAIDAYNQVLNDTDKYDRIVSSVPVEDSIAKQTGIRNFADQIGRSKDADNFVAVQYRLEHDLPLGEEDVHDASLLVYAENPDGDYDGIYNFLHDHSVPQKDLNPNDIDKKVLTDPMSSSSLELINKLSYSDGSLRGNQFNQDVLDAAIDTAAILELNPRHMVDVASRLYDPNIDQTKGPKMMPSDGPYVKALKFAKAPVKDDNNVRNETLKIMDDNGLMKDGSRASKHEMVFANHVYADTVASYNKLIINNYPRQPRDYDAFPHDLKAQVEEFGDSIPGLNQNMFAQAHDTKVNGSGVDQSDYMDAYQDLTSLDHIDPNHHAFDVTANQQVSYPIEVPESDGTEHYKAYTDVNHLTVDRFHELGGIETADGSLHVDHVSSFLSKFNKSNRYNPNQLDIDTPMNESQQIDTFVDQTQPNDTRASFMQFQSQTNETPQALPTSKPKSSFKHKTLLAAMKFSGIEKQMQDYDTHKGPDNSGPQR